MKYVYPPPEPVRVLGPADNNSDNDNCGSAAKL